MDTNNNYDVTRLHKLSNLDDYEVSENDPDIVDWKVYTNDHIEFGEVTDLVVDITKRKAVYAEVIVSDDFFTGEHESHLLIPLDKISLKEKNKMVIVTSITSKDIVNYPLYSGSNIPSDYEETLREKLIKQEGSTGFGSTTGKGNIGGGSTGGGFGTKGGGTTGGDFGNTGGSTI
jgi:photosynthetic reaction center H subunit